MSEQKDDRATLASPARGMCPKARCCVILAIVYVMSVIIAIIVTYYITKSTVSSTTEPFSDITNEPRQEGVIGRSPRKNSSTDHASSLSGDALNPPSTPGPIGESSDEYSTQVWTSVFTSVDDSDSTTSSSESTSAPVKSSLRLPAIITPISYVLEIQPVMHLDTVAEFYFQGNVSIKFLCIDITDVIVLHVDRLIVDNSSLLLRNSSEVEAEQRILAYDIDVAKQFMTIKLSQSLNNGSVYYLSMRFAGEFSQNFMGFYISSYNVNSTTKYLAVSQVAPTSARSVFPCFDEPALKARFSVKVVRQKHLQSLSNMPKLHTEASANGYEADVFQMTPLMSTYLLAFVVSEFTFKETRSKNNIRIRVWTRPEVLQQSIYALEVAVKLTDFFEEYFGIKYPLPKLDMVAVPDFAAGAMENWGIVTFRETALLYDPVRSPDGSKEYIAMIIAHEISHQWFGNIVTPAWWDDLWLNEGFATYMEYIGTDYVYPEWNMALVYLSLQPVLLADSLHASHPVYALVETPDDIMSIFDHISYSKGAALLRMLHGLLGETTFRKGLKYYLLNNMYRAADHNHLWNAFSRAARETGQDVDIKYLMNSWILEMNYPLISATMETDHSIAVRQTRFLVSDDPSASQDNYTWVIPITFTGSANKNISNAEHFILSEERATVTSSEHIPAMGEKDSWILINMKQQGFYRVDYERSNWRALFHQLQTNKEVINPINRAQIIDDVWSLTSIGLQSVDIALSSLIYLRSENEFLPWQTAVRQFDYIFKMLSRSACYGQLVVFFRQMLTPLYNNITWPFRNKSSTQKRMEAMIIEKSCEFDVAKCRARAKHLYSTLKKRPVNGLSDVKSTIYCIGVKEGGVAEWEYAYQQYRSNVIVTESRLFLKALACTREPWLLHRLLIMALDEEMIRSQDRLKVISFVGENPLGASLAWDYMEKDPRVYSMFDSVSPITVHRFLDGVSGHFNTAHDIEKVQRLLTKNKESESMMRIFGRLLETVQKNKRWMEQNEQVLQTWLINHIQNTNTQS